VNKFHFFAFGFPTIRTVAIKEVGKPKSKRGIVVLTNGENGDQLYKKTIVDSLDLGKELWIGWRVIDLSRVPRVPLLLPKPGLATDVDSPD
jgi:hypothetical protein